MDQVRACTPVPPLPGHTSSQKPRWARLAHRCAGMCRHLPEHPPATMPTHSRLSPAVPICCYLTAHLPVYHGARQIPSATLVRSRATVFSAPEELAACISLSAASSHVSTPFTRHCTLQANSGLASSLGSASNARYATRRAAPRSRCDSPPVATSHPANALHVQQWPEVCVASRALLCALSEAIPAYGSLGVTSASRPAVMLTFTCTLYLAV